jgi:hypothetical protein
MTRWTFRVVLTLVLGLGLAVAAAALTVFGADAVPAQPNVPVFLYGS